MLNLEQFLLDTYSKVLKINLVTEEFEVIKLPKEEKVLDRAITNWCMKYAGTHVHPLDIPYFLHFVDIYAVKRHFKKENSPLNCYYRRLTAANSYKWVCAEFYKSKDYKTTNEVILVIKEINDKVLEDSFAEARSKVAKAEQLEAAINHFRRDFGASLGVILLKTDSIDVLNRCRIICNAMRCYTGEDGQYVIFISDMNSEDFIHLLKTLHNSFNEGGNYTIASAWSDDEDEGVDYLLDSVHYKRKIGGYSL